MISSKDNQLAKLIRSLKLKKNRDEHGLFVLEGEKFVLDAIRAGFSPKYLCVSETYAAAHQNAADAVLLSDSVFLSIATTKTPQGILGVFEIPVREMKELLVSDRILYCNNVQNSENVGALVRSAVCAGYGAVVLDMLTADVYSEKAVRASAGAILQITAVRGTSDILGYLKQKGYTIIGSSLVGSENEDISLKKSVLVIGNEGQGMSRDIEQQCDCLVKIPIYGNCESLNAACAGTLLMYKTIGY
ncbi:MAG: TrmH family RNA methyltransferase [Anaerofustis sp.]